MQATLEASITHLRGIGHSGPADHAPCATHLPPAAVLCPPATTPTQVVFLGRLSARESGVLLDRLIKYCVFKLLFVSALRLPPTLDETAEWIAWCAPLHAVLAPPAQQ